MSKAIPRYRNAKRNGKNDYGQLAKLNRDVRLTAVNYLCEIISNIFSCIKESIEDEIMKNRIANSKLGTMDEGIYEALEKLMGYYKKAISLVEQSDVQKQPAQTREILLGIVSILQLRVSEFENKEKPKDMQNNYFYQSNPIVQEKSGIIDKCIFYLDRNMSSLYQKYVQNYQQEVVLTRIPALLDSLEEENISRVSRDMAEAVIDRTEKVLHKFYEDGCRYCITNINDLTHRQIASFYYEMLKQDLNILGAIVKIQVLPLEEGVETLEEEQEKELVSAFLHLLREAYQYFSKSATDIINFIQGNENSPVEIIIPSMTEFTPLLKKKVKDITLINKEGLDAYCTQIQLYLDESKMTLLKILTASIKTWDRNCHTAKQLYHFRKNQGETIALTVELIGIFRRLDQYLKNNWERLVQSSEEQIIKGIKETIEIKIESMNENKKEMKDQCRQLLADFENEMIKLKPGEMAELLEIVYNTWLKQGFDKEYLTKDEVTRIVRTAFESETFHRYQAAVEKLGANQQDKWNKMILQYKRDSLFFEISTYEEILHYSVPKLIESQDKQALEVADMAEQMNLLIQSVLQRNHVVMIRPTPHERFNAKEHEVLMSEKSEDFTKGEIIKLLNSGYKQNEVVVIRANVIAAQ